LVEAITGDGSKLAYIETALGVTYTVRFFAGK